MRIVCAWCAAARRPSYLGECPPHDDPTETHGICALCAIAELERIGLRAPTESGMEGD